MERTDFGDFAEEAFCSLTVEKEWFLSNITSSSDSLQLPPEANRVLYKKTFLCKLSSFRGPLYLQFYISRLIS